MKQLFLTIPIRIYSTLAIPLLAVLSPLKAEENQTRRESISNPTMDFGNWGVDLELIDHSIDPGNDFNAYVNGLWVSKNEIPSDRQRYGAFDLLREQSTLDVETLINDLVDSQPPTNSVGRRIIDAYMAFVDVDAIDSAGLDRAKVFLNEIQGATSLNDLVRLFETPGYPSLVNARVSIDARNPTQHVVSLGFSGLGLPDRDYYLVNSDRNVEIQEAYKTYVVELLKFIDHPNPEVAAEEIFLFESKVAELEWARQMLRLPKLTYNELSAEDLSALAGTFPIATLLETAGFSDQTRFLARQIPPTEEEIVDLALTQSQLEMIGGGLPAMMELLTKTPIETLRTFMVVRFLSTNAAVLSSKLDQANFDFFGRFLGGRQEQRARWKRAISTVEGQLGEQLGSLYVQRFFPPENKARMEALVNNLIRAMGASLAENEWMTDATIQEATLKLNGFVPMIGYPDEFETYEGLEISPSDPLANRISAVKWSREQALKDLKGPVDPTEWGMLPQTVNAYYSPLTNRIVFPAAILQPPFFNGDADEAVNYGGIGAVIGHEIGHGYDDQGSQFDAEGRLRNWWQREDREGFERFTSRMGEFIEQYCPVESSEGPMCLRGPQSMGETLGDVVGLQMAYRAYRLSLGEKESDLIDGLTGDQRFFLGFAQIWRAMEREESLRNRVMTANHPPGAFRLNNSVRHLDAWYDAFNVGPEHELYLPPEERIRIW